MCKLVRFPIAMFDAQRVNIACQLAPVSTLIVHGFTHDIPIVHAVEHCPHLSSGC